MKLQVGQLVLNRKLGLGKVLSISRDDVLTFFKNEQINPRMINVAAVPMEIAPDQSDDFFDTPEGSDIAKLSRPTKTRRVKKPKVAKAPKAPKAEKVEKAVEA